MRQPANLHRASLLDCNYEHPYPPLGFRPFRECDLGNGDEYGLYWPIGREGEEPIVAETQHDGHAMDPAFSCLDRFLQRADANGTGRWVGQPAHDEDPDSPAVRVERARQAAREQAPERAATELRAALLRLPEYGAASALLCNQYRRLQQTSAAIEAALQSLISPPCFGGADAKVLHWLARQDECPPSLADDPIWEARTRLRFRFGGTKTNDDYPILLGAIKDYIARGQGMRACTLMQCYAELMWFETVSFRERYGFHAPEFIAWEIETARQFGLDRATVSNA